DPTTPTSYTLSLLYALPISLLIAPAHRRNVRRLGAAQLHRAARAHRGGRGRRNGHRLGGTDRLETEAVIDPGSRGVQRGEHVPAVAGIGEQIRHQRADQAGAAMLGADRHPGHTARRDTYALAPRVEFAPHHLPEQPVAVEGTASMESRARPGPAAGVPALWRLVRTVRCVAAGTCVAVVARARSEERRVGK